MTKQLQIPGIGGALPGELIVDLFAGGGGASHGIEAALGRSPDVAINHDPHAVAMHAANHPATTHHCESIYVVDPVAATNGQPVGLLWASPDCRHFSKAKGTAPVSKQVRGLAWMVLRWAARCSRRPRVIVMENVEEFVTWGPVRRGRPVRKHRGRDFGKFLAQLRALGYQVEHRLLKACDYGAPTIRKRFFLIARCDGVPIVWPKPTHGPGLKPYRTAAECIDWSLPCPSIFTRKKPLAEKTLRRIAAGIVRYVIEAAEPFIVRCAHGEMGKDGRSRRGRGAHPIGEAMPTVTGSNDFALAAPLLTKAHSHGFDRGAGPARPANLPGWAVTAKDGTALAAPFLVPRYGERPTQAPRTMPLDGPAPTIVPTGNGGALCAAFLAKHYGGVVGQAIPAPLGTVTKIDHHSVVAAHLTKFNQNSIGQNPAEPMDTVMAGAPRFGLVAHHLTSMYGNGVGSDLNDPVRTVTGSGHHGLVAALLVHYYGTGPQAQDLREPMRTVVAKARHGLVVVTIQGEDYVLADIGMRMLEPHELAAAQGFPASYQLTGTKAQRVARVGNSVCPPVAEAVVRAQFAAELGRRRRKAGAA